MVFRAIPREAEPRSRYNDTSAALSNASEQVPGRPKRGAARSHLLVPTKCRSHDSPENRSQTAYAAPRLIFTLVALFHLVRIFEDWPIIIRDWSVPRWLSWIGLIVAGGLALLGFRRTANDGQ